MPETNTATPLFRLGSIGAKGAVITVYLLMFASAPLALSVFLAVVYAVVPLSIWRRKRSLRWRIPIGITFVFGYGWIILGFVFAFPSTGGFESQMPWYIPFFFSLTAGFFFLPLAAIGSITMLRERLETRSQQNS